MLNRGISVVFRVFGKRVHVFSEQDLSVLSNVCCSVDLLKAQANKAKR